MKHVLISLLVLALSALQAQNIIQAEYFIDTDPGLGNATPIPITSSASLDEDVTISTSSLGYGIHWLYTRVLDANGTWSLHDRTMVFVGAAQSTAPLVNAEYFWDTDPGEGNATPIVFLVGDSMDVSLNIPTTGLMAGTHYLHVRVQDQEGIWGLYDLQEIEIINDIGIDEIDGLIELELFPVPARDHAWLVIETHLPLDMWISIMDVQGRVIQGPFPQHTTPGSDRIELSLQGVQAGSYQVTLLTKQGRVNKRLIVH